MSDRAGDVVPGGTDPTALPDLTHRAYSAHRIAATVVGTEQRAERARAVHSNVGKARDRVGDVVMTTRAVVDRIAPARPCTPFQSGELVDQYW